MSHLGKGNGGALVASSEGAGGGICDGHTLAGREGGCSRVGKGGTIACMGREGQGGE